MQSWAYGFTWKELAQQLMDLHLGIAPLCVKITSNLREGKEIPNKEMLFP